MNGWGSTEGAEINKLEAKILLGSSSSMLKSLRIIARESDSEPGARNLHVMMGSDADDCNRKG